MGPTGITGPTGSTSFSEYIASNIDVLQNLANNLAPVQRLITAVAYILGLFFMFKALYSLRMYGEARTMMSNNANIKEPILYIFVGAVFLVSPDVVTMLLSSTFGSKTIMEYAPINSPSGTINTLSLRPMIMLIQTIGYIAFVRGWVLIARSSVQGQQPGGLGKGVMHVFGGILAINIVSTLQIVNNTIYGT